MGESLDSVLEKCLEVCGARSPYDAVAVSLHACLLAEGFVCIAIGDENFGEGVTTPTSSGSPNPSPYGLPSGWNTSQNVYALQYHHLTQKKLALVKMIVIDKELLITAMLASDRETVYRASLETDRYVRSQQFNSVSAYSNLLQLISTLNKEIVSKLLQQSSQSQSSSAHTNTASAERGRGDNDPLRVGPPRHPGMSSTNPLQMPTPYGYGDADRFPFGGGGGGGMIFDPLRVGRGGLGGGIGGPFPPLGHPPGARWDPVTPFQGGHIGRGRRRPERQYGYPDPDHLPPPGSDDMFL